MIYESYWTSYKGSITPIVGKNVQDCVTFDWIKIPTDILKNIFYISILYIFYKLCLHCFQKASNC